MSEFLIDDYGTQIWYEINHAIYDKNKIITMEVCLNNSLIYVMPHRDDGPAMIYKNGTKKYFVYGSLHRENGPAVIWSHGAEEYFKYGKRHNEDGPAIIEYENEEVVGILWIVDDIPCTFKRWCEKLNKSKEEINFLKLKWDEL